MQNVHEKESCGFVQTLQSANDDDALSKCKCKVCNAFFAGRRAKNVGDKIKVKTWGENEFVAVGD